MINQVWVEGIRNKLPERRRETGGERERVVVVVERETE